jgi:hypothetical protein
MHNLYTAMHNPFLTFGGLFLIIGGILLSNTRLKREKEAHRILADKK